MLSLLELQGLSALRRARQLQMGSLVASLRRSPSLPAGNRSFASRVPPQPGPGIVYREYQSPEIRPLTDLQWLWDTSAQHCKECQERLGLQQVLVFAMAWHQVLTKDMVITIGPARLQAGRGSVAMGTQAAHIAAAVYANGILFHEHCDPAGQEFMRECAKLSMSATQTLPRELNAIDTFLERSTHSRRKRYHEEQLRTLILNYEQGADWLVATLAGNAQVMSTASMQALDRRIMNTPQWTPQRLIMESYYEQCKKFPVPFSVQRPYLDNMLKDTLDVKNWPNTRKVVKSLL